MARPRKKSPVPPPNKHALRPGDLLVLRRNSSTSLGDFSFGEVCEHPYAFTFYEERPPLRSLVRRNLADYRALAVWRDGVLVAKVAEPSEQSAAVAVRVPTHPRLALRGQTG